MKEVFSKFCLALLLGLSASSLFASFPQEKSKLSEKIYLGSEEISVQGN